MHAEHGDTSWVLGTTYKASFTADGFTYVPFLGSDAPRNYPLGLRLVGASAGGVEVPVTGRAEVLGDGHGFTLARGAVDVRYELKLDSVEQLFLVRERPQEGAVSVVLEIETDLVGRSEGPGFVFEGPHGGVRYGGAVALDGTGRTVEAPAALDGKRLTITVPAEFAATVEGPLVIDPVLTTFSVATVSAGADMIDPDITYDRGSNTFCAAIEATFSASDSDVVIRRYTEWGATLSSYALDLSANKVTRPRIAGLQASATVLAVGVRENGPGGRFEIVGRPFDTSTQAAGSYIVIGDVGSGTSIWSNLKPDVGGNMSTTPGTVFAVVWERELRSGPDSGTSQGRMRTVDANGNMGAVQNLASVPGSDLIEFAISESAGDPSTVNMWNVCYVERVGGGGGPTAVWTMQLNPNGTVATPAIVRLPHSTGNLPTRIDISDGLLLEPGRPPFYVVAYDLFAQQDAALNVLYCRGNEVTRIYSPGSLESGPIEELQVAPTLATTADRFVMFHYELDPEVGWTLKATTFDHAGGVRLAVAARRVNVDGGFTQRRGVIPVASRYSGGFLTSRITGFAYTVKPTSSGPVAAFGGSLISDEPFSPAGQFCVQDPNSTGERGFIRMYGNRSTSTPKTVEASSLPPGQFALLLAGTDIQIVPFVGGGQGRLCVGGNLGRFSTQLRQIDPTGNVAFDLDPTAIPSATGLIAGTASDEHYFQVWHRDVLPMIGGTSNLTNAMSLRFTP